MLGDIFSLLNNIHAIGKNIEDVASKSDILGAVTRVYAQIGEKIKDYSLVEIALGYSNDITYDFRRLQEKAYLARMMFNLGKKVQAMNVIDAIDAEARKVKDLASKVDILLEIIELLNLLGEREHHDELSKYISKIIQESSSPDTVKVDSYLRMYRHFVLLDDTQNAHHVYGTVLKMIEDASEASSKAIMLRESASMFGKIAERVKENKTSYLMKAIDLLNHHDDVDDIEFIYNDVLKKVYELNDGKWIEKNLDWIAEILEKVDKPRIRMEIIHSFLIKVYKEKLSLDPDYVMQLIQLVENPEGIKLSPVKYVGYKVMKAQIEGLFVSTDAFFDTIQKLLLEIFRSSQFRKNLNERVVQIFNAIIEYFLIIRPRSIKNLELAVDLTNNYATKENKDTILKNILLAMVAEARDKKQPDLLERIIDYSKKVELLDERIFVSMEIGNGLYDAGNISLGKDIITACFDETINIKNPEARISAKIKLALIFVSRLYDIENATTLLENALHDANLYLDNLTTKTSAIIDITRQVRLIHEVIFQAEEGARHEKYNTLISQAREYLDQRTKSGVEKALDSYTAAKDLINESIDRYDYLWVSDQIDRVKNFLQDFSETKEFDISQVLYSKEMYKIQKSDIQYRQTISWPKKREMHYQIQITNNSRLELSELTCRIKKLAGEFLEPMHDNIQKISILKPGGTFTCEFGFIAKRDIVPPKAIESEISFFDRVNEVTMTLEPEAQNSSSYFKLFQPKHIRSGKFEKLKHAIEKKSHEVVFPFNVYITWKKLQSLPKKMQFTTVANEYNEIADQFFGVVRLYAESRWARRHSAGTVIQVIILGGIDDKESNVKFELYLEDPIIFYNLINLLEDQLKLFTCPSCNAKFDNEVLKPDALNYCKHCSSFYYFEANLKKPDKPLRFKVIEPEHLLSDDDLFSTLTKRASIISKEGFEKFMATLPKEVQERANKKLEKLVSGEMKSKEFITSTVKEGDMAIIRGLIDLVEAGQ